MESPRRDLLNDMSEHRLTLKNNKKTYYPRFSFTPKTRIELPKTGVRFSLFLCVSRLGFKSSVKKIQTSGAFDNLNKRLSLSVHHLKNKTNQYF